MKLELTVQGFKQWLSAYADEDPIGIAADAHQCPLSGYLRSQLDLDRFPYIYVDEHVYIAGGCVRQRSHGLPVWAQRFVRRIDALKAPPYPPDVIVHMPREDRTVTAREAREILEQVEVTAKEARDPS
jgi:hypothetical protein